MDTTTTNKDFRIRNSRLKTTLIAGMLFLTLAVCGAPRATEASKELTITASRFSFSPNEITLKKGQEVKLHINSTDATHGLVVEDLGLRTDVKKNQTETVTFTPDTVGTFEGKCAHFCGKGHGSMTFTVHVVD